MLPSYAHLLMSVNSCFFYWGEIMDTMPLFLPWMMEELTQNQKNERRRIEGETWKSIATSLRIAQPILDIFLKTYILGKSYFMNG